MNVYFRADASARVGTGHVMRCMALADALQRRGDQVAFLMREPSDAVARGLKDRGFGLHALQRTGSWDADARECARHVGGAGGTDWLVVDHYDIDYRWEEILRARGCKVLVIDDLLRHRHSCSVLVNQNVIADAEQRYGALVPPDCRLLLGPRYALLRDEFRAARRADRQAGDNVREVLVSLGGGDAEGVTLTVLDAIDRLAVSGLRVTVAVGASNPHRATIERRCAGRENHRLVVQTDAMAELMSGAGIGVGAGGISTWERCCAGLPAVVIAIADNQEEVSAAAAAAGACLYAGPAKSLSPEDLVATIRVLMANPYLRQTITDCGRRLVDGLGCERVAVAMRDSGLRLRLAAADDAERVFAWRNAEQTRRFAHDPRPLEFEHHLRWFRAAIEDRNRLMLIGETDRGPVGVLRYDLHDAAATVSIYLDPALHGQGLGPALLLAGESWLGRSHPGARRILARIQAGNDASSRAFAKAGFRQCELTFEKALGAGAAQAGGRQ
jgi:UDP-2,4-diacetamido-2,4,6-trideoxy-beta-L-altropyranose hydrolase